MESLTKEEVITISHGFGKTLNRGFTPEIRKGSLYINDRYVYCSLTAIAEGNKGMLAEAIFTHGKIHGMW